jgi:DNA polymerase-3 subunit epsilon
VARQVALIIETTGHYPEIGHRIVEIAAISIVNGRIDLATHYHSFTNPDRYSNPIELEQHGRTQEFLADKPRFSDAADSLAKYLGDADLVLYYRSWTLGFLDQEWGLMGMAPTSSLVRRIEDVVELSLELDPERKPSLKALCDRYQIDLPSGLESCLLDAYALGMAYIALKKRRLQ